MRLSRVDTPFDCPGSVIGQRGLLVIGALHWPTIERWDVDTKLTPDEYTCEFGWWTDSKGRRWKAIRVLLTPVQFERVYPEARRLELIKQVGERVARGRIYIHTANYAHQLAGCVSPGRTVIDHGVGESRLAMLEIFDALGSWREGEKIALEVS